MEDNFNAKIKELYGVDLDNVPEEAKEKYVREVIKRIDADIEEEKTKIEDLVKEIEEKQIKLDSISQLG